MKTISVNLSQFMHRFCLQIFIDGFYSRHLENRNRCDQQIHDFVPLHVTASQVSE